MKFWKELNYKERAIRSFYATCIFAFLILIPNYPIWIYVGILASNCASIVYNLMKYRSSNG